MDDRPHLVHGNPLGSAAGRAGTTAGLSAPRWRPVGTGDTVTRLWDVQAGNVPDVELPGGDGLLLAGPVLDVDCNRAVQVRVRPVEDGPLLPAAVAATAQDGVATVTAHPRTCPPGNTRLAFLLGRYIHGDRVAAGVDMPVVTVGCALRPEEFGGVGIMPVSHRVRLLDGGGRWVEHTMWEVMSLPRYAALARENRL
ncbi:hypothetical protein E0F15_22740 [Frankia sp. B2]|nr:hypothetical protein E0F15_22740 [Frankia sp. B2]